MYFTFKIPTVDAIATALSAWGEDEIQDNLANEKQDNICVGPRCKARFDYEGEGTDDLQFEEGDYIKLLEKIGDEWAKGELNGKNGIFPLVYVEIIEDLQALSDSASASQSSSILDSGLGSTACSMPVSGNMSYDLTCTYHASKYNIYTYTKLLI